MQNRFKQTMVLILFVVLSFVALSLGRLLQPKKEYTKDVNASEIVINDLQENTTPEIVAIQTTGTVLATTDGETVQCKDVANTIDFSYTCKGTENSFDMKEAYGWGSSGTMVSKNPDIEVDTIYIPCALLSGKKNFKDNTQSISKEDPIFKDAGGFVDQNVYETTFAPGDTKKDDIVESSAREVPFGARLKAGFQSVLSSAGDALSYLGEVVMEGDGKNTECPECQKAEYQYENYNPDLANKQGEYMYSITSSPGYESVVQEEEPECVSNYVTVDVPTNATKVGCEDDLGIEPPFLSFFVDAVKWGKCNTFLADLGIWEDECISEDDVIFMANSIFGDSDICEGGLCANSYVKAKNTMSLSPSASESHDIKLYAITKGNKVKVDGRDMTVDIWWEFTPIIEEYYQQMNINNPSDILEYPTEAQYVYLLKKILSESTCE